MSQQPPPPPPSAPLPDEPRGVTYAKVADPGSLMATPAAPEGPQRVMGFGEAVAAALRGWMDWKGRSQRSEFWWFTLAQVLASHLLGILALLLLSLDDGLQALLILAPVLAVYVLATGWIGLIQAIRRLHDIGHSGWWVIPLAVLSIIPLVQLLVIVPFVLPSEPDENKWGPRPPKPRTAAR